MVTIVLPAGEKPAEITLLVRWLLEQMTVHKTIVVGGHAATAHAHAARNHLGINRQKMRVDRHVNRGVGTGQSGAYG
jgi:hypothetical protein